MASRGEQMQYGPRKGRNFIEMGLGVYFKRCDNDDFVKIEKKSIEIDSNSSSNESRKRRKIVVDFERTDEGKIATLTRADLKNYKWVESHGELKVHVFYEEELVSMPNEYSCSSAALSYWESALKVDQCWSIVDSLELIIDHHFGNYNLEDSRESGKMPRDRTNGINFLNGLIDTCKKVHNKRMKKLYIQVDRGVMKEDDLLHLQKGMINAGMRFDDVRINSWGGKSKIVSIDFGICGDLHTLVLDDTCVDERSFVECLEEKKNKLLRVEMRGVILMKDGIALEHVKSESPLLKVLYHIINREKATVAIIHSHHDTAPPEFYIGYRHQNFFDDMSNVKRLLNVKKKDNIGFIDLIEYASFVNDRIRDDVHRLQALFLVLGWKGTGLFK